MDILQYIGVDYHPYQQTVAFVDAQGAIRTREFFHTDKPGIRKFYRQFPPGSVVGVEACGQMAWFEKLLDRFGLQLQIGNPTKIRKLALSPHKNDRRDAKHILELLRQERFPAIAPRSDESRLILSQLQYRHSLVKARTALANQLQALARSFGLAKFRMDTKLAEPKMLAATDQAPLQELIESRFRLFRRLSEEIAWLEKKLAVQAHSNAQVQLLMTHPGIGDKTGLAIVHTLGDIGRFRRAGEVAAFVGLVPLDKSSGQKKRIGKTSKMGPKLLRYLLGQAAHRSFADERLDEFYQRVSRRRGKPKAKVATARKLLERCYLMLRDNISYEEFRRRGEVGLPDCPVKESAG